MVVIDSTMLLLLFRPATRVPTNAEGKAIVAPKERMDFLVEGLEKDRTRILVPTPALSEILVRAGARASQEIVDEITKHAVFRVEPFDTRAAIELAAMGREDLARPRAKRDEAATYAKLKFDRQIVAIAKVNQATAMYSDDKDLRALASRTGMKVIGLQDLPLPPEAHQTTLVFGEGQSSSD